MYISHSLTTIVLLVCSSTYITTYTTDPVAAHSRSPRANAAAIENPLVKINTPRSHKRHDRFLSLSNHIAARAAPAPAVRTQDPSTEPESNEPTQPESNEPNQQESNLPAPTAPKQNQDDSSSSSPDPPEKPKYNESNEGGDDNGLETPEHPDPEDPLNSTATARCARQSGAGSASIGHCVVSATGLMTGTVASLAAAAISSFSSSYSAPLAGAVTSLTASTAATQAILSSSRSSSTNAPTTTGASPATGAAAGIDARKSLFVRVRIRGGGAARVFGTVACAVIYISLLI